MNARYPQHWLRVAALLMLLGGVGAGRIPSALAAGSASSSFARTITDVQPKMVKIYGAGGVRGLEAYQSGFLISAEGHIVTVWSYVLDTDYITATLNDGQKFEAKLIGADPRLELAVLKIEASDLPHFELSAATSAEAGTRVLAYSNLFGVAVGDEPASVQHGMVAATTTLDARSGAYETPYHGRIYVLDAMTNNPGAAGGALTNQQGQLLGMLGKELRSALTNTWLNYAVPTEQLKPSVDDILAGKSRPSSDDPTAKRGAGFNPAQFGIVLVPDVLERTPPYIDTVRATSAAAGAGLKADDLVVFVDGHLVHSCKAFREEIARAETGAEIRLTVMRDQELVDAVLKPIATPQDQK